MVLDQSRSFLRLAEACCQAVRDAACTAVDRLRVACCTTLVLGVCHPQTGCSNQKPLSACRISMQSQYTESVCSQYTVSIQSAYTQYTECVHSVCRVSMQSVRSQYTESVALSTQSTNTRNSASLHRNENLQFALLLRRSALIAVGDSSW